MENDLCSQSAGKLQQVEFSSSSQMSRFWCSAPFEKLVSDFVNVVCAVENLVEIHFNGFLMMHFRFENEEEWTECEQLITKQSREDVADVFIIWELISESRNPLLMRTSSVVSYSLIFQSRQVRFQNAAVFYPFGKQIRDTMET